MVGGVHAAALKNATEAASDPGVASYRRHALEESVLAPYFKFALSILHAHEQISRMPSGGGDAGLLHPGICHVTLSHPEVRAQTLGFQHESIVPAAQAQGFQCTIVPEEAPLYQRIADPEGISLHTGITLIRLGESGQAQGGEYQT